MESICSLVDSIPEHELIGLSYGSELLLKRAQRWVHTHRKYICCCSWYLMISLYDRSHLPFTFRKRILATGGDSLFRMQQPDSTVVSETSLKENSSVICYTSSVMSSSSSAPVDIQKPLHIRSPAISVDYDSDLSDSIINMEPLHSKDNGKLHVENHGGCDSPSNHSLTKPSFNSSKKVSTDLDGSDLFFSPKKPETVVRNKSNTAAVTAADNIEADDFYYDDFDIDDFNDSDIPEYFDEASTSSVAGKNSSAVSTVKEGGPSKSTWDKRPTTPASAAKPPKVRSPGKSTWQGLICACIYLDVCNESMYDDWLKVLIAQLMLCNLLLGYVNKKAKLRVCNCVILFI